MAEGLYKPLTTWPTPDATESPGADVPDRRRSPRYPFTAMAEVAELRSQARINGRCSDLSRDGCYVDSLAPFPVGTVVRVRLERERRKFEAAAKITYSLDSMGMGMAFSTVSPEHLVVLHSWLAELSGEPGIALETPAEEPEAELASSANLGRVLNELINTLVRKKVISETEAAILLRQIFS
jgi:hypothetical protein